MIIENKIFYQHWSGSANILSFRLRQIGKKSCVIVDIEDTLTFWKTRLSIYYYVPSVIILILMQTSDN